MDTAYKTTMRFPRSAVVLSLLFGLVAPMAGGDGEKAGTLVLVGDILRYNEVVVWERIFEVSGGAIADIVVIAAAHERARLYGGYAVRALSRYGPFVELLPVAASPDDFGNDHKQVVRNADLIERVGDADAVFFVGGAPQRLSGVLFNDDGSATPLASAVREVYASGGTIVGGIPGHAGPYTDLDALRILKQGSLPEQGRFRGLGLVAEGWHVDQHFFSPGRFAETLVAMNDLDTNYGIGLGPDTAAILWDDKLEVVGHGGVIIVDLTGATPAADDGGFNLKGARLSYLDDGDQIDMRTLKITPSAYKREGFEIAPGIGDKEAEAENTTVMGDMFDHNRLTESLIAALESPGQGVVGLAFPESGNENDQGFEFRFYTGEDTFGWLGMLSGSERYTARNIHLDIAPITRKQAENLSGNVD